jgi:hypothetical protein
MSASSLGPVSNYVRERLHARLDERRVVVWYDPRHACANNVRGRRCAGHVSRYIAYLTLLMNYL